MEGAKEKLSTIASELKEETQEKLANAKETFGELKEDAKEMLTGGTSEEEEDDSEKDKGLVRAIVLFSMVSKNPY